MIICQFYWSSKDQKIQSFESDEEVSMEFVETALSPRLQCEAISEKRRLHCNDPTGVSIYIAIMIYLV